MNTPELADLIWLFEDEPEPGDADLVWPDGLHSFHLRRQDREVLFSLDPYHGAAYITICVDGEEMARLGRLRRVEKLTIDRHGGREGLVLTFADDTLGPVILQTRPVIRLSWDVVREPRGRDSR